MHFGDGGKNVNAKCIWGAFGGRMHLGDGGKNVIQEINAK